MRQLYFLYFCLTTATLSGVKHAPHASGHAPKGAQQCVNTEQQCHCDSVSWKRLEDLLTSTGLVADCNHFNMPQVLLMVGRAFNTSPGRRPGGLPDTRTTSFGSNSTLNPSQITELKSTHLMVETGFLVSVTSAFLSLTHSLTAGEGRNKGLPVKIKLCLLV